MLLNYNSQTKMAKGEKWGWKTAILHLAPFKLSGKNVCPSASKECAAACLNTAGRGQMGSVQKARIRKTKLFWKNRQEFMQQLDQEIGKLKARAKRKGFKFAVRLNGTSDLAWERFTWIQGQTLMQRHPDVQFYDYTKVLNRALAPLPRNYHLTFSDSGSNYQELAAAQKAGRNIAVVFRDKLPRTYQGKKVIDGDKHDLRFHDPAGVVIGLVAKGAGRKLVSSFIREAR